jgi:ATP:corrinoid adenosyltransferase
MENKMNIFEKLSEVQNELKAPKNQRNTFGNYNYRSAEDILEAVKPLLAKNRLSLVLSDELVVMGEHNPVLYQESVWDKEAKQFKAETRITGSQRYYIKATATTLRFR